MKSQQNLENALFWNITPCSVVEIYWDFGSTYCFHFRDWRVSRRCRVEAGRCEQIVLLFDSCLFWFVFYSEDGGCTFRRNVGKLIPSYTVPHLRRRYSFYSQPWDPQMQDEPSLYVASDNSRFWGSHSACTSVMGIVSGLCQSPRGIGVVTRPRFHNRPHTIVPRHVISSM